MTEQKIDYRFNAQERIKVALDDPHLANAHVTAQIATAEATLALVEQQRIANLIALRQADSDVIGDFEWENVDRDIREGAGAVTEQRIDPLEAEAKAAAGAHRVQGDAKLPQNSEPAPADQSSAGDPSVHVLGLGVVILYCENQGDKFRYHANRILAALEGAEHAD